MSLHLLYLRDPSRETGGPAQPGYLVRLGPDASPELGRDEAEARLRIAARVTFLLHGFNLGLAPGRRRLVRLAAQLEPVPDGALVAVLWPGDHFTKAVSYPFEGRDADDSADFLAAFIERVRPRGALSFVSHSLGARVALRAIDLLAGAFPVEQVCLMAAALDDDALAPGQPYADAIADCRRVATLASRHDRVLRYAYPAADLLEAFLSFWRNAPGLALGYHGPRGAPLNVVPCQIPDERRARHGDYLPGAPPRPNQRSAVRYVSQVLAGHPAPHYPD
jgi:hypothetical protein